MTAPLTGLPGRPALTARGRGRVSHVLAPQEWRGTTSQVCGLYPWIVGAGSPTIGTPLGRHLLTGASVCFDPLSWFTRARLLLNPSAFVLGLPALGKSTLTPSRTPDAERRQARPCHERC